MARLNADGSVDRPSIPGAGIEGAVYCLAQDTNNLVWAGGGLVNLADQSQQHSVACLHSDGTVVSTFKPFDWFSSVYAVLPLLDGSLRVGGNFWDVGAQFNRVVGPASDGLPG